MINFNMDNSLASCDSLLVASNFSAYTDLRIIRMDSQNRSEAVNADSFSAKLMRIFGRK